ncbi:MAG TPA: nucleoside transporter C-terminal domain-containing protein [Bacteroidales bacterium]|nr:nucleoside transporter C-terminal domain-containing protein [Bacteroidales bacterium]
MYKFKPLPKAVFILPILVVTLACSGQNLPETTPDLAHRWELMKCISQPGGDTLMAVEGEFLDISKNGKRWFDAQSPLLGLNQSGLWQKEKNRLIFFPIAPNLTTDVDSVDYAVGNGQISLTYFSKGQLLASYSGTDAGSGFLPVEFIIEKLEAYQLILSDGSNLYYLSYGKPEVLQAQGFTFYQLLRGLLGMVSIIFIAWIFSTNRRAVNWKTVGIGLGIQILLAFAILKVPPVQFAFEFVGQLFVKVLDFTKAGTEFLFAGFLNTETYGFIFAFQVLPTIIFFSALTSLLFYLGIIQKVVYALAWLMTKAMRLSGAESLAVAGNIFLGQTEAPLMIKHYLPKMSRSEILLVMTGGMATMAGGVLAAYISFLGGDDPVQRLMFAKHLLAASVMAAPGAVVIAKILAPQTETIDQSVVIGKDRIGSNILDAISNGTTEGLKLAANVAAMLLVFIAFIAMFNFIAGQIGQWTNLNDNIYAATAGQFDRLSLQFILGYVFSPVMWLIGVSLPDITLAGRLLGEKIIMTEFIGYLSLAELKEAGAFYDPKTIIMATYMLCGFANFASIGIQIGGIGSLAPNQRVLLSQFGMRALLGGTLAALISATIVGVILG